MKSSKSKTIDEYEGLSSSEIQNKKLVNVLKHKMFKGFEIIKNSKTFYRKRPKCLRIIDFEEHNLEPYDVNYDIQYKREFLKKLYQPKFENPFIIQNYSDKKEPNIKKLDTKDNKKHIIFLTDNKRTSRKYISQNFHRIYYFLCLYSHLQILLFRFLLHQYLYLDYFL